ncbi:hypothetical protein O6H91_16G029100 [Diphasiastrum complanatum]|uniref:Uncharacterized protein n=1 Tax=Diphasiastrum complanatum TaxID=34168 RepID=A0ACC2BB06_DIPCM|nr:hypothetical protein O6H91_16G029100 [Diphasiastrum complanatum]
MLGRLPGRKFSLTRQDSKLPKTARRMEHSDDALYFDRQPYPIKLIMGTRGALARARCRRIEGMMEKNALTISSMQTLKTRTLWLIRQMMQPMLLQVWGKRLTKLEDKYENTRVALEDTRARLEDAEKRLKDTEEDLYIENAITEMFDNFIEICQTGFIRMWSVESKRRKICFNSISLFELQ